MSTSRGAFAGGSTVSGASGRYIASQLKPRILSLYRNIVRTAKSWESDPEARKYILEEAEEAFRDARSITSREALDAKLDEAERRLNLAQHYGIVYPRLHHLSTGALYSGKATAPEAARAAEAAAAASTSAIVQAPAVFGDPLVMAQASNPFSDEDDFEPPRVRSS